MQVGVLLPGAINQPPRNLRRDKIASTLKSESGASMKDHFGQRNIINTGCYVLLENSFINFFCI